jgi:hypothetical protein
METLNDIKGAFAGSLVRNNKKIREDRAIAITEEAEMLYKRKVEDLTVKIKQMKRERDNMLDMSPTDANSLVMASDFDGGNFVDKDLKIGVDIRNLEITLRVAEARYAFLFTGAAEPINNIED